MMPDRVASIRAAAQRHERGLPSTQRKRLGQHFSGLQVGRLLAHLALHEGTRTVLDPMAGSGDLLDATLEAALERGVVLDRLDGVEVHAATADVCRSRMKALLGPVKSPSSNIVVGSAFDQATLGRLAANQYDLVITNPPYVRFQGRADRGTCDSTIRKQLQGVLAKRPTCADAPVWRALADGYSGLADLSIPAWIVAAAMVRDGGRLAIVAPAAWRSRDYADAVRYLMSSCFEIERIVEGPRSAWFSEALVCTHLVVARRHQPTTAQTRSQGAPRRHRQQHPLWIRIGRESATTDSLVGADFVGRCPEQRFATWLRGRNRTANSKLGIEVSRFDLANERKTTAQQIKHRQWYRRLLRKGQVQDPTAGDMSSNGVAVPTAIAEILPAASLHAVTDLAQSDIAVGQGLRTGCNAFFYVSAVECSRSHAVVETASLFGSRRFVVPNAAIQPVVRRQADLVALEEGRVPDSRVLDLRSFALPEDMPVVSAAEATYRVCGEAPPQTMPADLANYVRLAAHTAADRAGKPVSELSAVRTNQRPCRPGKVKPRFWYMLPDFASRHVPAAAVPRVNHALPWTEANGRRLLVDANFATVWAPRRTWSLYGLKALLNSIWCRAVMEALCTPLGGGALKVEATHLRRLPVPKFTRHQRAALSVAGKRLTRNASTTQAEIDGIVLDALCSGKAKPCPRKLAGALKERAASLMSARRS